MYKMVFTSKEPLAFLEKLNIMLQDILLFYLKKSKNKNAIKANVSFYVDGVLNQVLRYFKCDTSYDLDGLNVYMKNWFKILFL